MIEHLKRRLAAAPNTEAVLIVANQVPLADHVVDRILAVNLLHEIRGEGALSEMRRVLAPMGVLLVVDWNAAGETGRATDEILYTAGEAASELRSNGFDTAEIDAGLPFHFAIRATHRPTPTATEARIAGRASSRRRARVLGGPCGARSGGRYGLEGCVELVELASHAATDLFAELEHAVVGDRVVHVVAILGARDHAGGVEMARCLETFCWVAPTAPGAR